MPVEVFQLRHPLIDACSPLFRGTIVVEEIVEIEEIVDLRLFLWR